MNVPLLAGPPAADPLHLFSERYEIGGRIVVSTHCLLGSGDHVTLSVNRDALRRESTVSDSGLAVEALAAAGVFLTSRLATRAEAEAERAGFGFKNGEFYATGVPDNELDAAVILLANSVQKWVAVEASRDRRESRSLDRKLIETLNRLCPEDAIEEAVNATGDSTRTYEMTARVIAKDGPVLFRTVTDHPASLAACHAGFSDIGLRPDAPRRVAVISGGTGWNSADISFLSQAANDILNLDEHPETALKLILAAA